MILPPFQILTQETGGFGTEEDIVSQYFFIYNMPLTAYD